MTWRGAPETGNDGPYGWCASVVGLYLGLRPWAGVDLIPVVKGKLPVTGKAEHYGKGSFPGLLNKGMGFQGN